MACMLGESEGYFACPQGHTALREAVSRNFTDIVDLLLTHGAEVNTEVSASFEVLLVVRPPV